MDPRVEAHAELVATWCTRIANGDQVVIMAEEHTTPLARAIAVAAARRGAHPLIVDRSAATNAAVLRASPMATLEAEPKHLRAITRASDVFIFIEGGANTQALADVPRGRMQAAAKAQARLRAMRLKKRWCLTIHPTDALAQEAGMSTPAFADLVYGMVLIDWRAFAKDLRRVARRFQRAKEVRIVSKDTDILLPVDGRTWVPSVGTTNLPSGEVFTAPVARKVEGHVVLDVPAAIAGSRVQGVRLVFEAGEVVDWSAQRGAAAMRAILDTDAGARRLGELGIGMHKGITKATGNILLDEKMGGTIHLALGMAYPSCGGRNRSAVHQDLIKRMGRGSRIEADGRVVQANGRFWYEDGFSATA